MKFLATFFLLMLTSCGYISPTCDNTTYPHASIHLYRLWHSGPPADA